MHAYRVALVLVTLTAVTAVAQNPTFTLDPSGPVRDFGHAVAVSGDRAVVASREIHSIAGSVYLYDVDTGAELHLLTTPGVAGSDAFGVDVAIDDDLAVIGAPASGAGSAYVYDVATGQMLFQLTSSDGAPGDFFGWGVGIQGDFIVVGAPGDDDLGAGSGSIYVFDRSGQELFKLNASNGVANQSFGSTLAIGSGRVVVGVWSYYSGPDLAYVFDVASGAELFMVTGSDTVSGDAFGASVGIDGNRFIVGAPSHDSPDYDFGAAYLFDANTGQELRKLEVQNPAFTCNVRFGTSVAISGNRVLVGAPDEYGFSYATIHQASNGDYLGQVNGCFGFFGVAAAIYGNHAIVGAQGCPWLTNIGQAFLYDIQQDPGLPYCAGDGSGPACPCANTGGPGQGCANSSGVGGGLSGRGSPSVSLDSLVLHAQLRPGQPALLFVGTSFLSATPFGDGFRCVGGVTLRLGIRIPNALGIASWGPGLAPFGMWSPGETRYFQTWYRDANGPCTSGFKFTNALEMTFLL